MPSAVKSITAAAIVAAGIAAMADVTMARLGAAQPAQSAQQGIIYRAPSGTTLRLMLDENNLGTEVSLGEMIFPPNQDSGEHSHDAIEIFYVVSGELEHVVNGKSQILKPGMSGFVRPPDKVRHKTGPAGAKVVVVWAPGIEGRRVASRWTREP